MKNLVIFSIFALLSLSVFSQDKNQAGGITMNPLRRALKISALEEMMIETFNQVPENYKSCLAKDKSRSHWLYCLNQVVDTLDYLSYLLQEHKETSEIPEKEESEGGLIQKSVIRTGNDRLTTKEASSLVEENSLFKSATKNLMSLIKNNNVDQNSVDGWFEKWRVHRERWISVLNN